MTYGFSSVPNCSATTSGEWFGSMMPPAPMRIVFVCAATCAMTTLVADDAMVASGDPSFWQCISEAPLDFLDGPALP